MTGKKNGLQCPFPLRLSPRSLDRLEYLTSCGSDKANAARPTTKSRAWKRQDLLETELGRSQFTFSKRKTLDSGGQVAGYMPIEVALLPYVRR